MFAHSLNLKLFYLTHRFYTPSWLGQNGLGNILLRNKGPYFFLCRRYFIRYHLFKHHWRPGTSFYDYSFLWWLREKYVSRHTLKKDKGKIYILKWRRKMDKHRQLLIITLTYLDVYRVMWCDVIKMNQLKKTMFSENVIFRNKKKALWLLSLNLSFSQRIKSP